MLGKISTQPHTIIVKKKLFSQKQSIVFAIFSSIQELYALWNCAEIFLGAQMRIVFTLEKKNEINTARTSLPSHQR